MLELRSYRLLNENCLNNELLSRYANVRSFIHNFIWDLLRQPQRRLLLTHLNYGGM